LRSKVTRASHAGVDSFTWNGRVGGETLGPGTYTVIATPIGGKPQAVTFKIVA
jgi:flagellar hook assembly protein FlgD